MEGEEQTPSADSENRQLLAALIIFLFLWAADKAGRLLREAEKGSAKRREQLFGRKPSRRPSG